VAVPGRVSLLLLTLAAPALSMETGFPDAGDEPTSTTHRQAHDLLAEGLRAGSNAPLLVVADLLDTGLTADDVPALVARLQAIRRRRGRRSRG
jgi:RND superfamily putative drug exporter